MCYNHPPLPACSASVGESALCLSGLWTSNNGEDQLYAALLVPEEVNCEKWISGITGGGDTTGQRRELQVWRKSGGKHILVHCFLHNRAMLTLLSWSLPSSGADRQEVSRAVLNPDVGHSTGKIQGGEEGFIRAWSFRALFLMTHSLSVPKSRLAPRSA